MMKVVTIPADDQRLPLNDLSRRALRRLARQADAYRRRDIVRFESLAADHHISARHLRLIADAWGEGGPTGLHAIGPAHPLEDWRPIVRAEAIIETWRRRHFPLDALETRAWRNRVTVDRMVPAVDRAGPLDRHPLMQVRRTDDGRWHLFRPASHGEWWPVVVRGRRQRQALSACLDAVRLDPLHHFWGEGGPPRDLAHGDAIPLVPRRS